MNVSLRHLLGWMVSAFRSREDLVFENLALRRQLLARSNQLLWRSKPLAINSGECAIYKDVIITGYGFSNEPEFLYVLNKRDGSVVQTIPVGTMPRHILVKGEQIFVLCYSSEHVFRIVEPL